MKLISRRHRHRWLAAMVTTLLLGTPARPARAEDPVHGTWTGTYLCGQGSTALTLILRPGQDEGAVDGLFAFGATPQNPGVPEGCFTMTGTHRGPGGEVRLSAGRWLLQPFGYVPVNLVGRLTPDGARLGGRVDGPLCRSFDLRRAADTARVPPACRGGAPVAGTVPDGQQLAAQGR